MGARDRRRFQGRVLRRDAGSADHPSDVRRGWRARHSLRRCDRRGRARRDRRRPRQEGRPGRRGVLRAAQLRARACSDPPDHERRKALHLCSARGGRRLIAQDLRRGRHPRRERVRRLAAVAGLFGHARRRAAADVARAARGSLADADRLPGDRRGRRGRGSHRRRCRRPRAADPQRGRLPLYDA